MRILRLTTLLVLFATVAGPAVAEPRNGEPGFLETVVEALCDLLPIEIEEEEPPPATAIMGGVDPSG